MYQLMSWSCTFCLIGLRRKNIKYVKRICFRVGENKMVCVCEREGQKERSSSPLSILVEFVIQLIKYGVLLLAG